MLLGNYRHRRSTDIACTDTCDIAIHRRFLSAKMNGCYCSIFAAAPRGLRCAVDFPALRALAHISGSGGQWMTAAQGDGKREQGDGAPCRTTLSVTDGAGDRSTLMQGDGAPCRTTLMRATAQDCQDSYAGRHRALPHHA